MGEQDAQFKCEWRNGSTDITTGTKAQLPDFCRKRGCDGLFRSVAELYDKKCEQVSLEPLQKEKKQEPPAER